MNGKEKWFSTKTTNRKEAQKIADTKVLACRGEGNTDDFFNALIVALARLPDKAHDSKRAEYARRLMAGRSSTLKIIDAWQAWLNTPLKGNPSNETIEGGYHAIWRRFLKWITGQKAEYLHEISENNAQDYSADLWKSGIAPRTFNGHVKFLKSMFRVLRVKAGLVENIWDNIKTLEKETQSRENFTPEELAAICSKATGSFRYMIGIGLYTGMRLGDVVNLRWDNIGKDSIKIIPSKTRRKGKQLTLPIHPALRILLNELKGQAGNSKYLFPTEKEEYQRDAGIVTRRFQKFLNDCGITTQEKGGAHRHNMIVRKGFHSLRHSFVSLCAANRVPQVAIQELVGHGSPAMTALYSHADFEQKQTAINGLPTMAFEEQKPDAATKAKA